MNAADALNAATYALRRIEKIATEGEIGFQTYHTETDKLEAINDETRDVLRELGEAGFDTEHNL